MKDVQHYSQWDFNIHRKPFAVNDASRDYDVIDNTKTSDWLRGLRLSHEQGSWYKFSSLLTVRESRRIKGRHAITLQDAFGGSHHRDTIARGYSDFDPHAFSQSPYALLGFLPIHGPALEVEIPLRACLPLKTANLMISCKAIFSDWEAFNFIRMSTDLQNLGYAVGIAAANSVEEGVKPSELDYTLLFPKIRDMGILPGDIHDQPGHETLDDQQYVELLAEGREAALFPALMFGSDRLPELLEQALWEKNARNGLLLSKALAWFGSGLGSSVMAEKLKELAETTAFRSYYDLHPSKNGNLKAGIIGEIDDYWQMN